jgi:DNA repair exonuclease SbcCD ATPase subunit
VATKKSTSARSKTSDVKTTRKEQLEQIRGIISQFDQRLEAATKHHKKQLNLLESVSQGLYEELDKLSKKAPAEKVTDLVLEELNEVIKDTKELIENDPYIQRLNQFVPAGDNPEHRDAVVVMKQVRQGLERFRKRLTPLIEQLKTHLDTARGMEIALRLYVDGHSSVTEKELKAYDRAVPSAWLEYTNLGMGTVKEFNFDKLDKIELGTFFALNDE